MLTTRIDWLLRRRWLTHSLFWLFVWVSAPLSSDSSLSQLGEQLLFRGVLLPFKMAATYTLVYYLIPRWWRPGRYLQFLGLFAAISFVWCVAYRWANIHIAETLAGSTHPKESLGQIIREWQYTLPGYFFRVYGFTLLFGLLKLVKDRMQERRTIETLEKEKAQAELKFLKAQLHPHFLFNTLNNLYALTLEKSEEAPEVVARLSEMLDYMLYQTHGERVPLAREVQLIDNYLSLERLRYGERLAVAFEREGSAEGVTVAPLILLSLVENAFKHGVSAIAGPAEVRLRLVVGADTVVMEVENTKPQQATADPAGYREGIGLQNVRRQLDLVYPDRYRWHLTESDDRYAVRLTLPR